MSDARLKIPKTGSSEELAKSPFKKLNGLLIPSQMATLRLTDLTPEDLLEILDANSEGGIRITFAGKDNARRLARVDRPRVLRSIPKLCVGTADDRATNMAIEGDNLQAMATLYKERGHVNLILADPPYNTGKDFRYNDKWDEDPNDSGLGEIVSADDGARHTKWNRTAFVLIELHDALFADQFVSFLCTAHSQKRATAPATFR